MAGSASSPLFILASASPRRAELLSQIQCLPDRIEPAALDETPLKAELPMVYAARLAHAKAACVAARQAGHFVLGADTVVALGRRILPKAEDEKTARLCLEKLSGRRHKVIGGVCLIDPSGRCHHKRVVSTVAFARLSAGDIEDYIASGEWHGKAGGYAIQGKAAAFVRWLSGSYSNVVGLPLFEVAALLRSAGYRCGGSK